jgi:hypothetical protein
MKLARTVVLLATLSDAPAFADCAAPEAAVQIPNGSEATRDEMIAAQKAVKAYDMAVAAYSTCMEQEQHTKAVVGVDAARLSDEYSRRTEAAVDKLQKLADRFNTELRTFKARNTG